MFPNKITPVILKYVSFATSNAKVFLYPLFVAAYA